MDSKTAAVTVRVVLPDTCPRVALMVVGPAVSACARPVFWPTEATAVEDEVQLTIVVRLAVLVSLKVPVAVNCCVLPFAIEGFAGVTAPGAGSGGEFL